MILEVNILGGGKFIKKMPRIRISETFFVVISIIF
ncbi:MAG: hypothetical protein RL757_2223 [Bacteroidota bacterium]|jgi:hypothetical protein